MRISVFLTKTLFAQNLKMPKFQLRIEIKKPTHYQIERILYTKNEYTANVKVSDWDIAQQSLPFDVEPLRPGSLNHFLSHYNRFGFGKIEPYITETHESLEQIYSKKKPINTAVQMKPFMNYFSYRDTNPCDKNKKGEGTKHECVENYLSTMHDSYTMPSRYKMSRLEFKRIPFLANRKIKDVDSHLSEHKYFDDDFHDRTATLGEIKNHRHVSYNPYTSKNSDGSVGELRKPKCYKLDF